MWALLLLCVVLYIFSILFTQGVLDFLKDNEDTVSSTDAEQLRKHLGSLSRTALTLYASAFSGISWYELTVDYLVNIHVMYAVLFVVFIAFIILAVMNVVTGVFVHSALESAQEDLNTVIQEEVKSESSAVYKLQRLFTEADADGDGKLSLDDFHAYLEDTRVAAYLRHMGLNISQVWGFFRLLDIDGSGYLDHEEFVLGCLRLRGSAKSVDIATLMYEQKRTASMMKKSIRKVDGHVGNLTNAVHHLQQTVKNALPVAGLPSMVSCEEYADSGTAPLAVLPPKTQLKMRL